MNLAWAMILFFQIQVQITKKPRTLMYVFVVELHYEAIAELEIFTFWERGA